MTKTLPGLGLILLVVASGFAQTGGGFSLEQNVIGNGGWRSDGGNFTVLGTMGQSNAGSIAAGGLFNLIDGLWAIENQSPNSPFVKISGVVTHAGGAPGISRVLVTIKNRTTNQSYQTYTGAHGAYELDQIASGANYEITLSHNHFQFAPIVIFIDQDRRDINFASLQ
ncbi:MAG TPA: carboxypeptidase-like regulatory domain-containing protein [Pyrinomonadaceae bacterium]|nr:carboxypeptidase-like regulatory domain-containing protein [Pyrinomonadaceae bacterium]